MAVYNFIRETSLSTLVLAPPSASDSVYSGLYGVNLSVNAVPGNDGTGTLVNFSDQAVGYYGQSTGTNHIVCTNMSSLHLGQLTGGTGRIITSIPAGMAPGAGVQAITGNWITLNPASTAPVTIEAQAIALTWIDNAVFNGNLTVTLDGAYSHDVRDVVVNGVAAAFVTCSQSRTGQALGLWGTLISGLTAAQVKAKLTVNGLYLVIH